MGGQTLSYSAGCHRPRDGAIIFRDLVGKLDVLNVECDKCGRRGWYHFHRLIERYGIDAKLFRLVRRDHGGLSAQAGEEFERSMRGQVSRLVEGGVTE